MLIFLSLFVISTSCWFHVYILQIINLSDKDNRLDKCNERVSKL